MIKNITIEGFKCFHKRQSIPLSQINLLYGKNGRGKSTIAQSFLLLAQTMKECNDIAELRLMGDLVALGTFDEVVNVNTESKKFYWAFQDDDNRIELGFEKLPQKTKFNNKTTYKRIKILPRYACYMLNISPFFRCLLKATYT